MSKTVCTNSRLLFGHGLYKETTKPIRNRKHYVPILSDNLVKNYTHSVAKLGDDHF